MASPISKNGTPLSSIFAPWKSGTDQAAATGIYENGADLCTKYAPLKYGTAAAATGIRKNGTDLNAIFAAYGTASYALPIDGSSYNHDAVRGANLKFNSNADGTYSVVNGAGTVLASGPWLPGGDSVSQYTVQFIQTGAKSGPDPAGGSNGFSNGAPTAVASTTTRTFSLTSTATSVGTNADNSCDLEIKMFKNGTLTLDTMIHFYTQAAG